MVIVHGILDCTSITEGKFAPIVVANERWNSQTLFEPGPLGPQSSHFLQTR